MGQPSRIIDFGSLPRDPDRDAALVDVRRPERSRDEIVLSGDLQRKLDRIEAEYNDRSALARLGLSPKSRLLFVGPPGCGKTLCAEILANDLGLGLLYARFDGIVSSYLGETATNLRRLFNYARQHQAVLFFDEFDALGKRRDDPQEVGELKRVVSAFCSCSTPTRGSRWSSRRPTTRACWTRLCGPKRTPEATQEEGQ